MLLLFSSMGLARHLIRIWSGKKSMTKSKEKTGKEERDREQDIAKHVILFNWVLEV